MATTLATFISRIGFEVDQSSLKKLDSNLKLLENRLSALSSKFSDISNNKTIAAAARLANAEAKRINSEIGLQNKKLQVSKIEGQTEKLKQQTSLAGIRLETKKAGTEQIYARANAQTMIQKMKVGSAADMAAIKESLDSGMKLRRKQESDQNLGRQILLMQKRNGFEESKLRRLQLSNQSQVHKVQMIAAQRNISSAQRVTELAQRAVTKSTPYAARSDMSEGSSGGRGRLGLGNGGLFGNISVGAGLGGVAGGLAAQRFGEKAYRTGNFQIAQAPQFEFITGSAEEADKQVSFLNKEVDRLSLNLMDASAQYRQLLASTYKPLGIEQTQKLFTSVQNLSAMMGLSTDAQNRSFRALSQMASKSQVYSEELNFRFAA